MEILLLYLLIVSMPFYGFSLINIGGRGFLPLPWLFAELLILVFFLKLPLSKKKKIEINVVGKAVLIFNLIAALSFVNLFDAKTAQFVDFFTKWIQLFLWSILFFAISNLTIKKEQLINIFRIWIFTAFWVSLYAIYQSFGRNLNLNLPFLYLTPTNPTVAKVMTSATYGSFTRCSSVFSEPSYLGSYIVSPILLIGADLVYKQKRFFIFKRRWLKWLIFFTLLVAFLLNFSLAGYGTLTVVAGFIFLNKKLRGRILKIGLVFLIVFILWTSFMFYYLDIDFLSGFSRLERIIAAIKSGSFSSLSGASFGQRLMGHHRNLSIWWRHPLLGVGINNIQYYYNDYLAPAWFNYPHIERGGSMWVKTLVEMGILGFIGLLFLWISCLLRMKQYAKLNQDEKWGFVPITFYYVLLTNFVNSFFTHQLVHIQRWFSLSMAVLIMFYIDSIIKKKKKT